jgi:hypothetical protein
MFHFFFTTQFYVTKTKIISKKIQHFLIDKYDLYQRPTSFPHPSHTSLLSIFSLSNYLYNPPNEWVHPNKTHQMDGYILNSHIGARIFIKKYLAYKLMNTPHELLPHGIYSKYIYIVSSLITLSMNPLTN